MKPTAPDFHESIVALDGYLRGRGTDVEAAAVEDDLFERAFADAAPELVFVDELTSTVRRLGDKGTLELYIRAADVERLRASSRKVQLIELANTSERQSYVVERDAEILLSRIPLDLHGVEELDIEVYLGDSDEAAKVMRDVAFDEDAGAVFTCCEGDLARATANVRTRSRYYGRSADGRRLIAELDTFGTIAP